MMLCTSDIATLHGVEGTKASNKVVHGQTAAPVQVSKWNALLAKLKNVFEKPGKLVTQMVDYKIKLLDSLLQYHALTYTTLVKISSKQ